MQTERQSLRGILIQTNSCQAMMSDHVELDAKGTCRTVSSPFTNMDYISGGGHK